MPQLARVLCYTGEIGIQEHMMELAKDLEDTAEYQFAERAGCSTPGSLIAFVSKRPQNYYSLLIAVLRSHEEECALPQLLREAGMYSPLLVCISGEEDARAAHLRAQLLRAGADACVTLETILLEELSAIARALLRRYEGHILPISAVIHAVTPEVDVHLFEIEGELIFDLRNKKLSKKRGGEFVRLSRQEESFFSLLVEARGEVVTHSVLNTNLYRKDDSTKKSKRVDNLVYKLRGRIANALSIERSSVRCIVSAHYAGYRIIATPLY